MKIYAARAARVRRHRGNRAAHLDLAATDDLLFALFSGGLDAGKSFLEDVAAVRLYPVGRLLPAGVSESPRGG